MTELSAKQRQRMTNASAAGTYSKWINDLKEIKEVTDPTFKEMCKEDLRVLQQTANDLLETGLLTSQNVNKMKIIVQRDVDQTVIICKTAADPNKTTFF